MRSYGGALVALLLLLGSSSSGAASSTAPTRHLCGKPTRIHAFHVEAEWTKKAYRSSEKAVVTVTVTRPAQEDPFELGIPIPTPVSAPEEGVGVTTSILTNRWPPPYGTGVTDDQGQVKFKIPLNGVKPGKQAAAHYASKWTNQGGCPDIEEWGFLREVPAFVVTD